MTLPNILFMHSHNTGQFVQPYGHAVPTPNMQKLAEQGILFRRAFAAAPTCSPSRAAFLSGMWAHSAGMLGLAHRGFRMQDYGVHIVRTLKANGYHTALAGVEHTAPRLEAVGYDEILSGHDTNYPEQPEKRDAAEAAVDFLQRPHDAPFFLSFGLNETHRPFPPAQPELYPAEDARYCLPPPPFPDTPETRADMADFKAAARVMDDAYGRVLAALDESGLADNTLVFCFSDHGLQFPLHMCNLTDRGLAVYLIVRGPGGFGGGRVVDALVSLIDLVPTAYVAAGIEPPAFVQGHPLQPLIHGETDALHAEIFGEVTFHAAYEPMRCVRTDRYKYIQRYDGRTKPVLPNVDDTPSKQFLLDHNWPSQPRHQEMLYDLLFDPHEAHNLIDQPIYSDILSDLRTRLERWMIETNDPLLPDGQIDPPPGARYNDVNGLSPREPVV